MIFPDEDITGQTPWSKVPEVIQGYGFEVVARKDGWAISEQGVFSSQHLLAADPEQKLLIHATSFPQEQGETEIFFLFLHCVLRKSGRGNNLVPPTFLPGMSSTGVTSLTDCTWYAADACGGLQAPIARLQMRGEFVNWGNTYDLIDYINGQWLFGAKRRLFTRRKTFISQVPHWVQEFILES